MPAPKSKSSPDDFTPNDTPALETESGFASSPDTDLEASPDDMRNNSNRGLNKDEQKSIEFVLRAAQERNVKFIQLWFTDILGMLKSVAIIADELETALEEGIRETVAIFRQLQSEGRLDTSDLEAPKAAPVVVADEP